MHEKLKILFVAQYYLVKEKGGPKVVMELAETINELGHKADVAGVGEIEKFLQENNLPFNKEYAVNINEYLAAVAGQYDIVDVPANQFYKFKRTKGKKYPLLIARSVLFAPHLKYIKWPQKKTLKSRFGDLIRRVRFGDHTQMVIKNCYEALKRTDLVNVSNHKDVEQLKAEGYPEEKIIHLPYGLSAEKRKKLNEVAFFPKTGNKIAFIGTFDYRKGCLDIPKIFAEVKKQVPDAKLTLFGAWGLFQENEKILDFFPPDLQQSVSIVPKFKESDLPELLRGFKVGIFPSYLEGFGFSVIELMAAGIPVIAYNAPGPSSMLTSDYLVVPGEWRSMARKVTRFLLNAEALDQAGKESMEHSAVYDWKIIAENTIRIYQEELNKRSATAAGLQSL